MTSEDDGILTASKDFCDVIEYLLEPTSTEKVRLLLREEAWERFVVASKLPRDQAGALRGDLKELQRLLDGKGKDMSSEDRLYIKRFITEIPRVKQELVEHVGKLNACADGLDAVHSDDVISSVVASSTGAVSGILTIFGLLLAPVTAGPSLVLLATEIGLRAFAAVTNVPTNFEKHTPGASAVSQACPLVPTRFSRLEEAMEMVGYSILPIASLAHKCYRALGDTLLRGPASWLLRAHPRLAAQARLFMAPGEIPDQSRTQVKSAFRGSTLAMTEGARVFRAATVGAFLLMDVISLVRDGSKSLSAEELRQQARELQSRLEQLSDIYKILQDSGTQ